jgi:hypothetical protein
MKRYLIAGLFASALLSASALAADMPVKAAPQVWNWTGFYLGAPGIVRGFFVYRPGPAGMMNDTNHKPEA